MTECNLPYASISLNNQTGVQTYESCEMPDTAISMTGKLYVNYSIKNTLKEHIYRYYFHLKMHLNGI